MDQDPTPTQWNCLFLMHIFTWLDLGLSCFLRALFNYHPDNTKSVVSVKVIALLGGWKGGWEGGWTAPMLGR